MRRNLPVTGNEVLLADDTVIVSKTTERGVIRSINRDFLEVSGFTEAELVGQPHNIVRHPDMPEAAFADMWASLKAGRPWVGMVKNRCRNGDHYWVEANATPYYADGGIAGFMSVRRKPRREQVDAAEHAYARLAAGDSRLAVRRGRVVALGLATRLRDALAMGPGARIAAATGVLAGIGAGALAMGAAVTPALAAVLAAGLLLAACVVAWTVRGLGRRTAEVADAVRRMGQGDFTAAIDTTRDDPLGALAQAVKSIQIRLGFDLQQMAIDNEEGLRIRHALDAVRTNVMIADRDRRIVYLNPAVRALLHEAQDEIRGVLPDFDADSVLGGSIDRFHVRPERQVRILDELTGAHEARLRFGRRVFDLLINPVRDAAGVRVATVVEWRDVTTEHQVDEEVTAAVNAAARGDFSRRVPLEGKSGVIANLANGVNGLLDTTEAGLSEVRAMLRALADGDLARRIDRPFEGAFGEIRRDANTTAARLAAIVARIRDSAAEVRTASGEIASGNGDLASRTEQQAASLEETAATMEELTATVRQNAGNAGEASRLAARSAELAARGGDAMERVVATMDDIRDASRRVGEIIAVIDGIAFQTNILALNAAVEAARAGEQGRGFAVVASEVRALAQRSAQAAREVKALVGASGERVSDGTALVGEAGAAMADIVQGARRVADLIESIAAASTEQSAGIEQVSRAVATLDEGTQQNAALVEQCAATALGLTRQAAALIEAVSVFDTGTSTASAASRGEAVAG